MFNPKVATPLQQTQRFGRVDTPAVSESTLERFHDLYSRSVEGANDIHALVLGATPELRDIVLSYGHILTTVDRNPEAIAEKSKQMHYQNNPNEEVVLGDWLHMQFPPASFDVILGDGVLTALSKDEQTILLDYLHDILKPTGYLLLREGAVLHNRPRYSPSTHIHEFRAGQYNLFDLFFGLRLYNQNFKSIDTDTRKTYLNQFKHKIDEYHDTGILSDQERQQLDTVGDELEHTLLHKEDLEKLLKKVFYSKDVVHDIGSGHLSPWYFFLTQRNDQIPFPSHVPLQKSTYVQDFLNVQNATAE